MVYLDVILGSRILPPSNGELRGEEDEKRGKLWLVVIIGFTGKPYTVFSHV